ncbi:MAG TPA: methyltransferase, TIGR04325 family, partial [Acetobacteraceae bacterium]|nr:methyltransferase, TIGR04325 family [Acetobacteraceae bacterium]
FAWLRVFMLRGNALCHPTALIRRTVFDGIGGYDPLLFQLQDYDLWVRLCARYDIKVLGEHVTGYRVLEGRNTSWPGAETRRRTAWEKRRVLRRFLAMDAAVIRRTLGAELSALGLPDGMPPHIGMALLLAETSDDPARQAFALDVLEQAVEGGEFETGAFFRLSGRLDPFRVQRTLDDAERLAQAERRATEAEALACQVTSSATWRSTAPLRRLVASQPLLRGMLRRLSPRPPAPEEPSLPPAVAPVAHPPATGQATPPEWEHVPEGWRADDPRRLGWNHPSVAETQRRKWPGFLETLQGTRPLGIYHEAARIGSEDPAAHNFVLAFAYVLARAAAGRNAVSVLDWGGGIGHYAAIARAVLPEVRLDYTVLDLPDLCATGRELLPDVRFVSDAGAWSSRRYDLVFASGALQYADDWRAVLNAFAAASARWVFLSRTPFVEEAPGFVVVQRPHSAGGYRTEYLSRVFNRPELLAAAAEADLELEREFLMVGERVAAVGAPAPFEYRGFLFAVRRPAGEAG